MLMENEWVMKGVSLGGNIEHSMDLDIKIIKYLY